MRDESADELDLTAAIDVVFQLLIFFMVCGAIQPSSQVTLPRSATGEGLDAQRCLNVGVRAPQDGSALLDAPVYFVSSEPEAILDLEQATSRAAEVAQSDPGKTIVIKADTDARNKTVLDLVTGLKARASGTPIRTGVKEKQD